MEKIVVIISDILRWRLKAMIITNGLVYKSGGEFSRRNIVVQGEIIKNITESDVNDELVIDATDMYVIPGLIDVHLHGCVGYDFCDGNRIALEQITSYELSSGITTICPTSMTFEEKKLKEIFVNAATFDNKRGARIAGINMEGPFISPHKIGAQNAKYIQLPNIEMFNRLQEVANGLIKIVNIAPELDNAMEFIEKFRDDVKISIAHTNADYNTSIRAFENGANHVTHLYNAMPSLHHRNPGVIGAAADKENVYVELITDGIHVDGTVVRATFKMFGEDRIVFVSDSMEACGMVDGEYMLGGQKVYVTDKKALLSDGTIAGSATNLMDCVRNAVNRMNIPLEKAVKCATENPAKSLGIYDKYGSIDEGKIADIVILNKNLNIEYVIKDGCLQ